jgi:hypothetical protein
MPYGTLKCDNITFDNGGVDKLITVSGLFYSTSGALTVTGTISGGNVTAPTATFTTLTGTTTAGTTATFTSGAFTSLTGVTTTGTTATFTSGSFTSLTGVTTTVTSGVFGLGSAAAPSIAFTGDPNTGIYSPGADQLAISTNGTGQLFVDANGNVGLGASPTYQLDLNRGGSPVFRVTNGTTACYMQPESSSACARIGSLSNHPLAFAINGLEVSRFDTSGRLLVSTSSFPGNGNEKLGISSSADGIWIDVTGAGGTGIVIDRTTADGDLINFLQAGAQEGAISVSGTTVTYGGGHLARWSQLPNDENPSALLKGTVMSNLDEMCEWGDEDNEQLNKTKVSDVEGDPNVAGVFVSTSFSDDGPLDYFCAMTGDMIIRIAEGVVIERGDLLMSAGDGTAKPQSDDIIRSKTVAKVTSTHVTCTYEDGSYCVPCVLMAC